MSPDNEPTNPVLTGKQAARVLRERESQMPLPIGLEARVDPPHLGKELAQLRALIRKCGKTRTTVLLRVTQNMAEAMLFLSFKKNRRIFKVWVERLKVILLEGRFHNDSGRMIFDWEGDLRDGQHRLTAIYETGIEVEIDVTFGVDPEVFQSLDVGLRRNAQQFLELAGVKYAPAVAAIVRLQYRINHIGRTPDDEEVYREGRDLVDDVLHRALIAATKARNKNKVILSSAALAYRLIALAAQRGALLDEFWDRFVIGDELKATSPIFKLRDHFKREANVKQRKAHQFLTQTQHAAWIIQAWNAWTTGQTSVGPHGFKWSDANALPVVK